MTIRVIEQGKQDWFKKYHAICKRCKCKFECSESDGVYETQDYGCEGNFVRLSCPNCNYECIAYG